VDRQSAEGRKGDERGETNLKPNPTIAIDTLQDTDNPASRLKLYTIGGGRRKEKGIGKGDFSYFPPNGLRGPA